RKELREPCDQPAREIEEEIANRPQRVLDVVSKDPEEPHIPDQMKPAAVQKHHREEGSDGAGKSQLAAIEPLRHAARDERVFVEHALQIGARGQLVEERDRARRDDENRDEGKAAGRIAIPERDHLPARKVPRVRNSWRIPPGYITDSSGSPSGR